jgi:hypothetical protein
VGEGGGGVGAVKGGSPFKGKLQREAYHAGRAARVARTARELAPGFGDRRSLVACWEKGWDDAAREAEDEARRAREDDEAKRRAAEKPRMGPPRGAWPADKPLPAYYERPPVPCPTCRRLLDNSGGRAAVLRFLDGGVAYFRCRATRGCPPFKLPVKR